MAPKKEKPDAGDAATARQSQEGSVQTDLIPKRAATSKDYMRIFSYGTKWDLIAYVAGGLSAAIAGATTPLMLILFGDFVDHFSIINLESSDADLRKDINRLCLYVVYLFVARFVLSAIHKFAFRMIGVRLSAAIRLHYLNRLFSHSIYELDTLPPGHAVGTLTATSNIMQLGISERFGTFVECVSLILTALIVALIWNWELSLVTLAGLVSILLIVGVLMPLTVKGKARQVESESQAAAVASETFAGIRMIMACGAQKQMVDKYAAFIKTAKKEAQSISPIAALQFALTFFGIFGTVALTFWYGTVMFTKAKLENIGEIVVVLMALTTMFFSFDRLSVPLQSIGRSMAAACEFFAVIDAPLREAGKLKEPDVSATGDIIFDNVTFAYPSRPHITVLDSLDLRIESGKITAIVGPSGSGKSTIVGLIERWYTLKQQGCADGEQRQDQKEKKPGDHEDGGETNSEIKISIERSPVQLQGTVKIGGQSLDDVNVKWWRSQIGLVQQEPFLFDDSIYNNVAHGLIGSSWENESEEHKRQLVKKACEEAYADEFISKLPEGYKTMVGSGGAKLSGGQRQRIAIARSIIKNPAILILDEATSAIDVRGERIVQEALDRVSKGRTTITIAHRLSTVKAADRIVVLQKGKVVESGTHQSLTTIDGGLYARLVTAQAVSLGDTELHDFEDASAANGTDSLTREETLQKSEYHGQPDIAAPAEVIVTRGFFKSLGRFFHESKAYWNLIIFFLTTSLAAGTAQPLYAWLFANSIDLFKYQEIPQQLMDRMDFMCIMWTVFAASASVAYFSTFASSGQVAASILAIYRTQYFESLVFQRAAYFDEAGHSQGTLVARVRDDPVRLEEMMGTNIAQLLIAIGNVIGGVVMALAYSWKLALVSFSAAIPVCIFSGYIRFRYELLFEKLNDEVFAESSRFGSEAIGAFRTVVSLGLEDSISARFESLSHGHVVAAYKKARWVSIVLGFSESATLGFQALIFYYGGQLLANGEIGIVAFFVCLMAMMGAAEAFGQSLNFGPNAAQATAASNRILDARGSRLAAIPGDTDIPESRDGIEINFRNIRHRYPGQKFPALDDLTLAVEKGQFVALVGASGSGKTNIVSLLQRFYEPESGQILFNGKDIAEIDVYTYRRHLALVAQEPTLFQGTIRDNVLLGMDAGTVTDDELYSICRDASIHDFVMSLPEGYNTDIGPRGVSLSGGQKQRIAIARALMRKPQILILDEATSFLDSESERSVQAAFERAAKGRTMIVVAHRLATVHNADVIFVLGAGGRLLEKGNHQELLRTKGVYYQMCQNQALG